MTSSLSCGLVLNAGSTSLKTAVYMRKRAELVLSHFVASERLGTPEASISLCPVVGQIKRITGNFRTHAEAFERTLDELSGLLGEFSVVGSGHRMVFGPSGVSTPQLATSELLDQLRSFAEVDSEHLPSELALVEICQSRFPEVPHVLCFDTAFHSHLPSVARLLPIPRRLQSTVQRRGFHGISCESLLETLRTQNDPTASSGRVILAHLGGGASLTAVKNGVSIDTTMSFSPTSGVPMSTRSGDLDPSISAYLVAREKMTADQLQHFFAHESGLLGMSGKSGDMRDLLALELTNSACADALAVFCYQIKKTIGSLTAALNGLDTLVFAGGIGEHSAEIRRRICDGLQYLGLEIEADRNANSSPLISSANSRVRVRVIATQEEEVIARALARALKSPLI